MSSGSSQNLDRRDERRRWRHRLFWRIVNPPTRQLAGWAPWWVLLQTTGRRTGRARTTPLARGPLDGDVLWLASVHGRRAAWVRNIEAEAHVRLKLSGRWRTGRAEVMEYDEAIAARFNAYARSGPRTLGIDPALVRVTLSGEQHRHHDS